MSTVLQIHNQAMDLAEEAATCQRKGSYSRATELLHRAFELERQAAEMLVSKTDAEPTRSVLYRSAASLALDCKDPQEAGRLIAKALAGNPPKEIAGELRDLLEQVYVQQSGKNPYPNRGVEKRRGKLSKEITKIIFGNKSASIEEPTDLRSFLGEGTEITGDVRFTEIMRVDSTINGTITSDSGSLLIMEKGQIKAAILAGIVEVSGTIEGTITAKSSVKIHSTGRVYGDIYTPSLIIENGALFDGKCHMLDGKNMKSGFKSDQKPLTSEVKTADAV